MSALAVTDLAACDPVALAVCVLDARATGTSTTRLEDALWTATGDPCTYVAALERAARIRLAREATEVDPSPGSRHASLAPRGPSEPPAHVAVTSICRRTVIDVRGPTTPPWWVRMFDTALLAVAVPVGLAVLGVCAFIVADFVRSVL